VNLLDNAAKHSGTKEHILLSAEREGGRVRLSVEDSGRGMTADERLRVFELFYRAGDRAEHRPGLGVGLALVKSLIELHGGAVEAYSAGLGRGSRFSVYLPVYTADRPLLAAEPAPEPPQVARLRVLVVDDNQDSTESLAALLKMWGHEVETAADGIEACERAESFRPDVALLDLSMPRLDGYGAARRIRLAPWAAGIVLVAQTGWGQASDRRQAEAAGFDFHLTKPVNFGTLRKILAEARHAPDA
jgi:CheY-like chemotaxis protein